MKNSFLSSLYFMDNDTGLYEKVKKTEEYNKLKAEADKYYEELEKTLSKEQKELFAKFLDNDFGADSEAAEQSFIAGFKCGVRLAAECLCDDDMCNT